MAEGLTLSLNEYFNDYFLIAVSTLAFWPMLQHTLPQRKRIK